MVFFVKDVALAIGLNLSTEEADWFVTDGNEGARAGDFLFCAVAGPRNNR